MRRRNTCLHLKNPGQTPISKGQDFSTGRVSNGPMPDVMQTQSQGQSSNASQDASMGQASDQLWLEWVRP